MSDPKVIYLGPECEDEFCDGRTWADHVAWPDCDCKHKPVRYNIGSDFDAALAREAALRDELSKFKSGCVDLSSQVRELEHKMDYYKGEGLRADALQQRLTDAEKLLGDWYTANAAGGILVADEDYHLVTATAEMLEQARQKEGEVS